ncbi:MAG TPA: hypothetical protein VK178_05950 [Opitutaceae bacterium]|nr:hypothetical protein [Opitutaceae bacterium]
MTAKTRVFFFAEIWPAVCARQGWKESDRAKRHEVVATCMRCVRGPQVESITDLGPDEVTALFCYCEFLATETLEAAENWDECMRDYHTYNRARQADWHERSMYGTRKNKLDRQRFGGAASAVLPPAESLDPEEVRKRHLTMATRHQTKMRKDAKTTTAEVADREHVMPDGALDIPPGEDPF